MPSPSPASYPPASLYSALLGHAWTELGGAVRCAHSSGGAVSGAGHFSVRRGRGVIARFLALLLKLPPEGEEVPVEILMIPEENGERWQRSFNGIRLVTVQARTGDGLMEERLGSLAFHFDLAADTGRLVYRQVRAVLLVGQSRVPLPRWCAPQVAGQESPSGDRTHVSVTVTLPYGGLLLSYSGEICIRTPEP